MKKYIFEISLVFVGFSLTLMSAFFYYMGAGYEAGQFKVFGVNQELFFSNTMGLILSGFQLFLILSLRPLLELLFFLFLVIGFLSMLFPFLFAVIKYPVVYFNKHLFWNNRKDNKTNGDFFNYISEGFEINVSKVSPIFYMLSGFVLFVFLLTYFFAYTWQRSAQKGSELAKDQIIKLVDSKGDSIVIDGKAITGGVLRCSDSHCAVLEIVSGDPKNLKVLSVPISKIDQVDHSYSLDQKDKTATEKP
ncbi:hypothetical protein Q4498_01635 [Neptunomonas phycophila]|uniref:hypothetical protein n=1 Tax=Neptunomonas phycophila TaxID=1572645 RepID=UPI0026E2E262|nr:hypothetical protein [Neptunomonas phycophila]MDO6466799.1 hypothetical protein [Neptunomonas phycophila]